MPFDKDAVQIRQTLINTLIQEKNCDLILFSKLLTTVKTKITNELFPYIVFKY